MRTRSSFRRKPESRVKLAERLDPDFRRRDEKGAASLAETALIGMEWVRLAHE
jgi:hypothetical protein